MKLKDQIYKSSSNDSCTFEETCIYKIEICGDKNTSNTRTSLSLGALGGKFGVILRRNLSVVSIGASTESRA